MQDVIIKKPEGEKVIVNKTPEQKAAEVEAKDPSILFKWSALEYPFKPKTNDWFWTLGVITLALAVASYFLGNFFFGVIVVVGGFSLAMMGARKPNTVDFKITEKGVRFNSSIHPYSEITSFCINEDMHDQPRLFLKLKSGLSPYAIILINKSDTKKIEEALKIHSTEEAISEPFASLLLRLLGV
jgi:hypothetical protein